MTAIKPEVENQRALTGEVDHVELDISSRGILKPVGVLKKALPLGGVQVARFTLHNMKTVVQHGIGPGATVKLIRSGDVIPRFMSTVKRAKPNLPIKCPWCKTQLKWTESKTDLCCDNISCNGFLQKRVIKFFAKFKIDNLGKGTIKKLIKAGYNTVPKILNITPETLATIEGFALPSAKKVCKNMQAKLAKVDLAQLMSASGIFQTTTVGFDKKRFAIIIHKFGEKGILERDIPSDLMLQLLALKGIGTVLAEAVAENLPVFREFYKSLPSHSLHVKANEPVRSGKFKDKLFCWTKYRSKDEEEYVAANGGIVTNGVNKKTFVLFAADMSSSKIQKARSMGVKIVPRDQAMKWLSSQ